tara:strand:+ start:351 stop:524 length:174 start_codon:yes stop_codon:yes gene_type:complete
MNETKRNALIELQSFWNIRMSELVEDDQLSDADSLYFEFNVDEKDQDILFLEYLNDL